MFRREQTEEERRGVRENLTEEELVIYDLLTKPDVRLTRAEQIEVRNAARSLLQSLKRGKLVLDWRKNQTSRAQVRHTIDTELDQLLPRAYSREIYEEKCHAIFQHFYELYPGEGRSIYATG